MFLPLPEILLILEKYKYLLIFPITIVEGPIIIIISGFLYYLGFLNIYIIFPLLILGDTLGDAGYYAIGKYSSKIKWIRGLAHFLGLREKEEEALKNHFKKHLTKTLLVGKISHGIGSMIQASAGLANVDFWQYIFIEIIGTIPKTIILFYIGFYIGDSYIQINSYLKTMAHLLMSFALISIVYFILKKRSEDVLKADEKDPI